MTKKLDKLQEINFNIKNLTKYSEKLDENTAAYHLVVSVKENIQFLLESNHRLLLQNIELETKLNKIIDKEDE
ncbi:MAG: hypothetical protein ACPHY8_05650 [Patescibacteria group bacterium]